MGEHVFKLPDLGEGMVEAEIVEWLVHPGDKVREGAAIANLMTDKANIEVPAPVSGVVLRTAGQPGERIAVGAELAAFAVEEGAGQGELAPAKMPGPEGLETAQQAAKAAAPQRAKVLTSPAVRRLAKENGVELAEVPGSGPRGRILKSDLEAFLSARNAAPKAAAGLGGRAEAEQRKLIGVRRVIAERMVRSKREIPHFAYVEEIDVTELEALRRHLRSTHGWASALSLLPFVCLAVMRAVAKTPQCNATYDADAGVLKLYRHVHLGVATHTPDGLKVPVVRSADGLALPALAAAIAAAAAGARDNRLQPRDLTGSTITVSSLGKLGGIVSTPIINHPETTVIGVNKAVQRPVVVDGQITVRVLMNLSSSFDHRFVDGHDAASFIQEVRMLLEHPATLFMPSG